MHPCHIGRSCACMQQYLKHGVYSIGDTLLLLSDIPRTYHRRTPAAKNPRNRRTHPARLLVSTKVNLPAESRIPVSPHIYTEHLCVCARYQVNPKVSHLHAVKRIFRYLKGQPKLGLWYPKDSPFDLVAYTDSDYAGASLDRKSTTRGCQFLGSRLISWQCKK
ncbi:hypothetical protein Tco_0375578 [Tanacetum coccineum]